MPLKRIVLIIMCVMLFLTVTVMAIVVGKVAPVFDALLNPPEVTQPSTSQTQPTVPTTTEPTVPTTTQPTVPPTSEPTVPPTTKPDHKHDFSTLKEEKKASCTEMGYKIYTCSCGEEKLDAIDKLAHSYGIGKLVSPTCTEEGYTLYTCSVCEFEDKRNVQEALGHDMKFVKEVKVTCEQQGYIENKCSRAECGEIEHKDIKDATGHNWEKGDVHKPTCTENGYTEYSCSNENCDVKTKKDDEVDALGHAFGQWKIKIEPASGKAGTEERECSVCKEKETRDIELGILIGNGIQSSEDGNVAHWIINVGAKNSNGKEVVVYSYEIADNSGLIKRDSFVYDPESGLIVTFQDKEGKNQTYPLTSDKDEFIFDKNGKLTTGSGGTTPSEPSGGSTTPSEPSGGSTTPSEPSGGSTTPSEPSGGTTPGEDSNS